MASIPQLTLPNLAAACTLCLGVYGGIILSDPLPALLAIAFVAVFAYAMQRVAAAPQKPPRLQLVLVLALVAFSFALHLKYLPSGIGCFFTLMLTKNELLLPTPRAKRE